MNKENLINYWTVAYSRTNIDILNRIHIEIRDNGNSYLKKFVEEVSKKKDYHIIHQGVFLGYSYLCIVWLWEKCKQQRLEQKIIEKIDFELDYAKEISGPRNVNSLSQLLRLLRNAFSHARIDIDYDSFIFRDIDRKTEREETIIKLSWKQLAILSDKIEQAVNDTLSSLDKST